MINIGTNLLYNGKNFLDLRQGHANSLEDLKTWDLNIPPGFEVCVNGEWYVYNPEFEEDEITGKFRKIYNIYKKKRFVMNHFPLKRVRVFRLGVKFVRSLGHHHPRPLRRHLLP
jgi:hypothetical protein